MPMLPGSLNGVMPGAWKAHTHRLLVELDPPGREPFNERVANAFYFMTHEDEFKGDEACLPFLDHLAKVVAKDHERSWERQGARRLLGLDIGANIGAMTPMVIECCGGNAAGGAAPVHVVAIEPNPVNLPQLESEVQRLRTDPRFSVSVCTAVASDSTGPVRFHVNRKRNFAGNQHGSVHYFEGEYEREDWDVKGGDPSHFLELTADTVDHLLWGDSSSLEKAPGGPPATSSTSGSGGRGGRGGRAAGDEASGLALSAGFRRGDPVDFVKIDTEGHEFAVLRGMTQTLRRTRFIFFEVSHLLRSDGASVEKMVLWLRDMGFHTYRVGKKALLRIDGDFYHPIYDSKLFWSNCLAMREDEPLTAELLKPFLVGAIDLH